MGLDMYLYLEDKETAEITEYSYYRKFNALQGYFSEKFNIANCGRIELDTELIEDVYRLLNEIRYDKEKAGVLMPTFPGPFFGSYDYDRIYHSYIDQAASDFYHAKFIDFNKYRLFYTSNW